jgi:hypothetical protein
MMAKLQIGIGCRPTTVCLLCMDLVNKLITGVFYSIQF